MFYSHDILQKKGGKFGIVWIAATRTADLTRRQYMSVKVRRTCDDIIDYILLRAPGTKPGHARPRLSLYLSAQLMYGTIKVFNKQHVFLYDDTTMLWSRLRMSGLKTSTFDIDLKFDPTKQNLPDLVGRVDPLSAEYDHQFGVWDEAIQDIRALEQEIWRDIILSPEKEMVLSSPVPVTLKEMVQEALRSPHTVSSLEDIKLKEDHITSIDQIQIQEEKDLPGFDGKEISYDKQLEDIPIEIADLISPRKTRSHSTSSLSDVLPIISEEQSALPPVTETPQEKMTGQDAMPETRRVPVSPGVTPIQPEEPPRKRHRIRPSLPMNLEPVTPSPVRKRRKRQPKFYDVEMQISKKQLRTYMATTQDICRPHIIPAIKPSTFEALMSKPGKRMNHQSLLHLWTRNAVTKPNGETQEDIEDVSWTTSELIQIHQGIEERRQARRKLSPLLEKEAAELRLSPSVAPGLSSDSDTTTGRRRSKRLAKEITDEKEKTVSDRVEEQPSLEVGRADSVMSLEGSLHKDISLEIEKSHQSFEKSVEKILDESMRSRPGSRRGSVQVSSEDEILLEPAPEQAGVSGLETVQEEEQEVRSPSTESNYQEEMMRHIESRTATKTWTRFSTICPTDNTNRSYAAKMFNALLELTGHEVTVCRQKGPYEDIYIQRGDNW